MNTFEERKARWRRAAQLYTMVAIVGFNSCILFTVLTLLLNVLLSSTITREEAVRLTEGEVVPVGVHALYSARFRRDGYYSMSPGEVDLLLAEYDRMAREGHWQVNPWTGLTMRPFRGHHLNIDVDGKRSGLAADSDHAGQIPLIVWAFGGSTLFGWGLADDYTVPSQLQEALQAHYPARQVQVINFAVPIYNSSQELALFAAALRRDPRKPDIAVFLDGVNDVWYTMYLNTQTFLVNPLSRIWEQQIWRLIAPEKQPWITVNSSFPPYRLAEQMGIQVLPEQALNTPRYAFQGTGASNIDEQLAVAIETYRMNVVMADAIGEAFEVETYFFLQPFNDETYYPAFRQAILDNLADTTPLYDVSDTFDLIDHEERLVLIDDFHYSDYGSGLLATRMADLIAASRLPQ